MINVGDWVRVKVNERYVYGYVDYISESENVYLRKIYTEFINSDEKYFYGYRNNLGMFESYRIEKLDQSISDDDLNILIDIALDMNDREWFLELTKRREGIKRNGSERSGRKAKEVSN
ncbi:IDEAL domain-containing protein [Aeribacillus composti]|uniref:IDEAL domain-containing protein n=1 Tax=Aeribacillus composti TaxID=1868734 RepID=UPI002E1CC48B|nr:IDEAL domain-containing protein [Aeribacillus composti]